VDTQATGAALRTATHSKRLRLFLRDYRVVEARVGFTEGQTVASYLASRKKYMNLQDVFWVGTGEKLPHVSLQVAQILWASAADGDIPVTHAHSAGPPRLVEISLESGLVARAGLTLVANQRLSDYLETSPQFIPLRDMRLLPRDVDMGDMVINQDAIQMVRELHPGDDDHLWTGGAAADTAPF
jgi:hypothetical protein